MTTFIFITGFALTVAGVAMISVPGAFIAAGVFSATFAVVLERGRAAGDES
jgi:hypothetical protein